MRKFFIILCGVLVMSDAFGYRDVQIPKKITDSSILNAWGSKFDDWNSYTIDVYSAKPKYAFAPDWQFNTKAGTYGTNGAGAEGSIVAIIARDIWKNGGRFCTTQIQAAESGSNDWIDYHGISSKYKCENICRPEYSGDKCAEHKFDCDHMNVNYLNDLDNVKNASLRLLDGKQEYNITKYVDVFHYLNDNASNYSYAMVLGVLDRRQHSVLVAPVRVLADDGKMDSARAKSGAPILLCAPGYIASDSITKDCIPAPQCGGSDKPLCPNETADGYQEDQHEWQIGDTCKKFRCKNNKGFKSENDKTCVECEGGALAYVNSNGLCDVCKKGETVPNATKTGCDNISKSYTKEEMKSRGSKECWLETDLRRFAGCVRGCPDSTPCYDGDCKLCN